MFYLDTVYIRCRPLPPPPDNFVSRSQQQQQQQQRNSQSQHMFKPMVRCIDHVFDVNLMGAIIFVWFKETILNCHTFSSLSHFICWPIFRLFITLSSLWYFVCFFLYLIQPVFIHFMYMFHQFIHKHRVRHENLR